MILQFIRNTVGDAGFKPRTFAPEVWCATNESPHLNITYNKSQGPLKFKKNLKICKYFPFTLIKEQLPKRKFKIQIFKYF